MIEQFESGKWYRWTGSKERPIWFHQNGIMDFLLDGKPHQCKRGDDCYASFYDSPDDIYVWNFTEYINYFEEVIPQFNSELNNEIYPLIWEEDVMKTDDKECTRKSNNHIYGISPLQHLYKIIQNMIYMEKYNKELYRKKEK